MNFVSNCSYIFSSNISIIYQYEFLFDDLYLFFKEQKHDVTEEWCSLPKLLCSVLGLM